MAKQVFNFDSMERAFVAMRVVREQSADAIQRIEAANGKMTDAKNVADDAKATGSHLWQDVFQVASAVYTATADCTADREIVLHGVLRQFLDVEKDAKMSTAGQYASTAKKLLAHVTRSGEDISKYADKNRREILDAMRDKSHAELLEKVKDATKEARFIVKHGDNEARKLLADCLQTIKVIYGPIKAKKESEKAAVVGAKELADLRQRHPAAPMTVETVAAIVADDLTSPVADGLLGITGNEAADLKRAVA